jgi:CBS domain-containing protein
MAEKETVTEEAATSAETAGPAAEEITAKENAEAAAMEEAVESQEPRAAEQAEPEASTEVNGEEKAEEETVTEEAAISAEIAGPAVEEITAKEDTEAATDQAVESKEPQAAEQAEPEASTEANGEEKAEEATVTEEAATSAETAEPAAEEITAKEDTEAATEQTVESKEPQAAEQAEPEASTEANGEEKTEEATITEETAEPAAEETTTKEDKEADTEQAVESKEPEAAEQAEPEASTEANGEEKVEVTSQTTIESQTIELSKKSLDTFCKDIAAMFGVNMGCKQKEVCDETVEGIKKRYEKPIAVNCIKAEGTLEGTFEIILNREGLFILAGAIAMPEQMTSLLEKCVGPANIQKNIKSGSLKEAEAARDTLAEAGNLLVGCWDRIFREEMEGHGHFVQTNTFIGDPWDNPEEKIGLASDEEFLLIPYEMTIEPYSPFRCGVIFPQATFGKAKAEEKIRAEAEAKVRTEAEEKAKAEAEEKGKAEAEAEEKAKTKAEEKAKAEAEFRVKAENEARAKLEAEAKAEAEEQGSDADESSAKEDAEASAEEKDAAPDVNATDDIAEEEAAAPDESEESAMGGVSETIQKMTRSAAVLPGESAHISLAASAKDIMQKDVVWGSPDDSVGQTLTKMQQHDTGYVMIGHGGVLEGIVSKSDITGAISPYLRPVFAKWRRPLDDATLNIRVKWIMSRPVRTIKPETSLAAIMENMRQSGGRCLPVVGQQGKVQGLVTIFDIFKVLLSSKPKFSSVDKTPQASPLA